MEKKLLAKQNLTVTMKKMWKQSWQDQTCRDMSSCDFSDGEDLAKRMRKPGN